MPKKPQPQATGWVFTSENIREVLATLLEFKHKIDAYTNSEMAHAHAALLIEALAAQKAPVPGENLQPSVSIFFREIINQI